MTVGKAKLDSTVGTNIKNRCQNLLPEAEKQVQNRLQADINTWKCMPSLSPSVIISQRKTTVTYCISAENVHGCIWRPGCRVSTSRSVKPRLALKQNSSGLN